MWPFPTPFDLILHFFRLGPPLANLPAKFDVSRFYRCRDMEGIPKFQKVGHVTLLDPFWPNFAFFSLGPPVANLCAKCEVCSFNLSWDMERGPKLTDTLTHWLTDSLTDTQTDFIICPMLLTHWADKTHERFCTINGSKCVKSAKDVSFGGFAKNGYPCLH